MGLSTCLHVHCKMGYKYTDGQCVLFIDVFLLQIWGYKYTDGPCVLFIEVFLPQIWGYKYTDRQCVLFIDVFLPQIWLPWSENRVSSGPRPRMEGTPPVECTGSLLWETPVIVELTVKNAVITTFPHTSTHTHTHTMHTHRRPRDQQLSRTALSWAPRGRDNPGYQQTHTTLCPKDHLVLLLGQNLQVSLEGLWICLLATGFQAVWVKVYDRWLVYDNRDASLINTHRCTAFHGSMLVDVWSCFEMVLKSACM